MKAVVYTAYGSSDVLQLKEVEKPIPQDDEVLIKVCAASINAADVYLLKGKPFLLRFMAGGLQKPKKTILGADVAGRVEAVGKNATAFKPGDEVFGRCESGGFAEYTRARASLIALKPTGVSFADAAAAPMAGMTALQSLRDGGRIQAGQKVLINGASGGVGTFAVQLAKLFGAEVTAVCSTRNVEMVRSLGADDVIDYTKADFTKQGQQYDLILGVNGSQLISDNRRALKPQGVCIVIGGGLPQLFQVLLLGPLLSIFSSQKFSTATEKPNQADLAYLGELLQTGKLTPVIDGQYPLSETAEVFRLMENRRAQGKLVITLENGSF